MEVKSLVVCYYLSDECGDDPTNNLSEFGESSGLDENMKQDKRMAMSLFLETA
jgi:hypothetical protein